MLQCTFRVSMRLTQQIRRFATAYERHKYKASTLCAVEKPKVRHGDGASLKPTLGGKVIIVTGAGGGIGEGCASVAARQGAHVVVVDINSKRGTFVANQLGASYFEADVSETESIDSLVK